jgi:hypothetical protein
MQTESRRVVDHSAKGAVADVAATFAGVFLLIGSLMDVLQGAAAIANPDFFAAGSEYLYDFNVTAWGWIHVALGVVSVLVGIGILMRQAWGQVMGMIVAGLGILTNFAWLPHHPLWSIVIIAFYGFVIWALSVQLKNYR